MINELTQLIKDLAIFVESHWAILVAIIAWFKNEIKATVPAVWNFLGQYKGYKGIWLYIKTGEKQTDKV